MNSSRLQLALLVMAGVMVYPLSAQTVSLNGPGYLDLRATSWTPPNSTDGARLLWYPDKDALRFGNSTADWNSGSIGLYSFGGGYNANASGKYSFSYGGQASNFGAISIGVVSKATGIASIAIGGAYSDYSVTNGFVTSAASSADVAIGSGARADGGSSVSIGSGSYSSNNSVAIGTSAVAVAGAVSLGSSNYTNGYGSSALGSTNNVSSGGLVAIGTFNTAVGKNGIAIGTGLSSQYDSEIVLGVAASHLRKDGEDFEIGGRPYSVLLNTDPIFSIGNGYYIGGEDALWVNSSALTLYRDGTLRLTGSLQVPKTTPYIEVYDPSNLANTTLPKLMLPTTTLGSFSFSSGSSIGVGTATPAQILHVVKSSNTLVEIQSTAAGASNTGLTMVTPDRTWTLGENINGVGAGKFNLYDATANASRLTVDAAGNVGIGTPTPAATLDVVGTVRLANGAVTVAADGTIHVPARGGISMGNFQ